MIKKLLILIIVFISLNAYCQFSGVDTVNVQLIPYKFVKSSIGTGRKAIHIQNTSAYNLLLGFADDKFDMADTSHCFILLPGKLYHFFDITSKSMYLKNGHSDMINTVIHYGPGVDINTSDTIISETLNPDTLNTKYFNFKMDDNNYFQIKSYRGLLSNEIRSIGGTIHYNIYDTAGMSLNGWDITYNSNSINFTSLNGTQFTMDSQGNISLISNSGAEIDLTNTGFVSFYNSLGSFNLNGDGSFSFNTIVSTINNISNVINTKWQIDSIDTQKGIVVWDTNNNYYLLNLTPYTPPVQDRKMNFIKPKK